MRYFASGLLLARTLAYSKFKNLETVVKGLNSYIKLRPIVKPTFSDFTLCGRHKFSCTLIYFNLYSL